MTSRNSVPGGASSRASGSWVACVVGGLVVAFAVAGDRALRADEGPGARPPAAAVADPWPLAGSAPSTGASSARAVIDAVDGRRQALSMARVAVALESSVAVPTETESSIGTWGVTLSPSRAAQGLNVAARRASAAELRTVPEIASVLAAAAFDGSAVSPERRVLTGPLGTVDRVFQGRFVPSSIDDRPYVLRPNRISDLKTPPPPPPPRPTAGPASDIVVRGVRIDVDEALLRRALTAPGAPAESEALDALEDRLLTAADGDAAVSMISTFATERKAALFASRAGAGGLRRVSLKALLDPKSTSGATVGGLTRILGVSCDGPVGDRSTGDITLIGIEESGAEPVPFEALALAMTSVWREGRVPGCSLDPDPSAPSGPQKVRVFGVPGDSRFALTMLEADYMMKRVVGRSPGAPTGIEGLVDLPEAIRRAGTLEFTSSRFWLTPVPPGPGDVWTAPVGVGALFEARVRVRTEEMRAATLGVESGTGGATAASSECAKSMSERYDVLAERIPEFRRLRALFDVVTCARVLRILAPRHPLLDRLADVPYARAEVPPTYAGITVTHQLDGRTITLMGGCELDAQLPDRAFLDVAHPAFAAISAGGRDGGLPGPRPTAAGGDTTLDDSLLAASAALAAGRYVEAEYALSDLLDRAPDDPEILSMRGVARVKSGFVDAGILDAIEAAALDPSSMTLAATVRYLRAEAGDATAFDQLPAAEAEVLEATYLTLAAQDGAAHRFDKALVSAATAVKVRPGSSVARLVHATLLMLTGDTERSAKAAADAAAADPTSTDARLLTAIVALRRGDAKAARVALDQSLAIKRSADAHGYRAVARALEGDLAGAAADAAEGVRLDAADPAVAQALEWFRGAACLGVERAMTLTRAQLSLPPSIQIAIYDAQSAQARGADAEAAAALERALAGLDAPDAPKAAIETGFVRETLGLMLAKALRAAAAGDEDKRTRMESLVADVERRHPDWPSPHYVRGGFAQSNGDSETALAAFARCRELDPKGDMILAQSMPADATSLRQMLASLEFGLLLMSKGGPGDPRMGAALDRLEASLRGTSTAPVVPVFRTLLEMDRPGGASNDAMVTAFRGAARALSSSSATYGPCEAIVRAMFHAMHVNAELTAGLDGVAAPMAALRGVAPRTDVYEPIWNAIASTRKEAVMAVFGKIFQHIDADPRAREADELAISDPEAARRLIDAVMVPTRERLAKVDDPVLTFAVERFAHGAADTTVAKGMATRLRRIDRVLEVAVDAAKIAKLEATKRAVLAELKALDARATRDATAARRDALASLRTPVDVKSFALVTQWILQRDAVAPLGESGPDDARRAVEVRLLAYLRAVSIPVPASLK